MKKVLIIDSSYLTYKSYFAYKNISYQGQPLGAFYGFASTVMRLCEELSPTQVVFARDLPKPTWRHKTYGEYKAGRKPPEEEMISQIPIITNWCEAITDNVFAVEGYEADDIIYTICCNLFADENLSKNHESVVVDETFKNPKFPFDQTKLETPIHTDYQVYIYSSDKDLYQLFLMPEVYFLKTKRGSKTHQYYGINEFWEQYQIPPQVWIDYKTLMGDPSDNLKGLDKVGPKTAAKTIQELGSLKSMFDHLGLSTKDFGYYNFNNPPLNEVSKGSQKILDKIKLNYEDLLQTYTLSQLTLVPKINPNETLNFEKGRSIFEKYNFKSLIHKLPQLKGVQEKDVDSLF